MSKIAEQKAKDIAKKLEASQAYKFDNFSVVCGAIEGYNKAMQDFLEKACDYLMRNHPEIFDTYTESGYNEIEKFKEHLNYEL